MSNPSDESLMLGVAGGDSGAFEQLVVRHQELVWRTAYRMVGDRQAAEDLAQDAFVRVFRAADRYRPTAAFRTYLYRIVVRVCLDHLRKKRPQPGADLAQVAEPAPAVEQQTELRERADLVQQAVASLGVVKRNRFGSHFCSTRPMTQCDFAVFCGVGTKTANSLEGNFSPAHASLPPKQRSAVVLRYYEGLSGTEIADVMKTTPKAVERLLARGRSALQRRLARLLDDA